MLNVILASLSHLEDEIREAAQVRVRVRGRGRVNPNPNPNPSPNPNPNVVTQMTASRLSLTGEVQREGN